MELVGEKYKQTEVGLIPCDWEVKELGKIAFVNMGQSPLSSYYNSQGIGLPLVQGNADVENRKTIIRFYTSMITKRGKVGDIIMSVRAPVGEVSKAIFECCLGRGVCSISFDNEYIYQYLIFFEKSWAKFSTGSTFDSVNSKQVKELKIPLPPTKTEQTAIATALSEMDELIAQTEKLIEKKKAIKQGVMQELLRPKKGWETKKLGDYGRTYGGITGKTKIDFGKGNSHYIPFMNIMSNPMIDVDYMDSVEIKPNESQNKVQKGDLFFNGSSETPEEVGLCSVLDDDVESVYLNSFCFGYRMYNMHELNGLFLSYLFRSPLGRSLIFSLAQGATRYNLSKTNLLKLELPIPNKEEQDNIAKTLLNIDNLVHSNMRKLRKLKLQKQGMMQALLTGKIRLV